MMYRNETTGRRYTFVAPDSLERPDVVMVPFPAAALRRPTADGIIGHDCNPCIVPVTANDPKAELRAFPQGIQPASMLIVENETDKPVTVSGIPCYPGDTVMMYTGGADSYGYAVFGKVVAGLDVIDKIAAVKTGRSGMHRDVPVEDIIIEKTEIL